MNRYSRIFIALTILLSGLALIPQVGIFAGVVSWQRFAVAYEDVVTVTRARYRDGELEVRARTTAGSTPTLTVYRTADNSFIGTLTFEGSDYRGEFNVSGNPQVITVRSSLGGESTVLVTDGSGTPVTVTPSATVTPGGPTNTPSPTNTPAGPTNTPTVTNTPGGPTETPSPTNTPGGPTETPSPTNTPGGPTETPSPTNTPGGPTETPSPTNTPGGPTETPSPTNTPGGPTETPSPTNTPGGPTETPVPTITPGGPTLTPTATITPGGPTLTPTTTPPSNTETLYLPFVMQTAAGNSGQ